MAAQNSAPSSAITIEPEIPVELTADDNFAGRDPVLEAIVAQSSSSD